MQQVCTPNATTGLEKNAFLDRWGQSKDKTKSTGKMIHLQLKTMRDDGCRISLPFPSLSKSPTHLNSTMLKNCMLVPSPFGRK